MSQSLKSAPESSITVKEVHHGLPENITKPAPLHSSTKLTFGLTALVAGFFIGKAKAGEGLKDQISFELLRRFNCFPENVVRANPDKVVSWSNHGRLEPQKGNSNDYADASREVQYECICKIIEEFKEVTSKDGSRKLKLHADEIAIILAIARHESGFNPDAAAASSSATGLFQFIKKTGKAYGLLSAKDFADIDKHLDAADTHVFDMIHRLGVTEWRKLSLENKAKALYAVHHDGHPAKSEKAPGIVNAIKHKLPLKANGFFQALLASAKEGTPEVRESLSSSNPEETTVEQILKSRIVRPIPQSVVRRREDDLVTNEIPVDELPNRSSETSVLSQQSDNGADHQHSSDPLPDELINILNRNRREDSPLDTKEGSDKTEGRGPRSVRPLQPKEGTDKTEGDGPRSVRPLEPKKLDKHRQRSFVPLGHSDHEPEDDDVMLVS